MNTKQLVKNKILLNKVAEYFTKNPDKKSVVVKANLGEGQVYWRAVREAVNKFAITEVRTSTEQFMLEINNSKAQPAAKGLKKTKDKKKAKIDPSPKESVPTQNPSDQQPVVGEKPLVTIKAITH